MAKRKPTEEFSAGGYRLSPIVLDDNHWLYEHVAGVEIYVHEKNVILNTGLGWPMLCDLVDNHRKIEAKKSNK